MACEDVCGKSGQAGLLRPCAAKLTATAGGIFLGDGEDEANAFL